MDLKKYRVEYGLKVARAGGDFVKKLDKLRRMQVGGRKWEMYKLP